MTEEPPSSLRHSPSERPSGASSGRVVLPDGYYLDHFSELVHTASTVYDFCLAHDERRFIELFTSLTEDEKRLFVRFHNRKGTIFFRSKIAYSDISSVQCAIDALLRKGFLRRPGEEDLLPCLQAMTRAQLMGLVEGRISGRLTKDELVNEAQEAGFGAFANGHSYSDIIVQCHAEVVAYLSFLAFGRLQRNLSLYTLRDLGIRRSNGWRSGPSARFATEREARSEFLFLKAREAVENRALDDLSADILDPTRWPKAVGPGATRAKEKLAWELAQRFCEAGRAARAIAVLRNETSSRSIEKRIRLVYDEEGPEAVKCQLERVLADPPCSEALLFAEDFWARKFEKRRLSAVTQALRDGATIVLDASYRGSPESGVRDYYVNRGIKAIKSENFLWMSLFGIVFWEELFDGEAAAIYSEFERIPKDLLQGTFYDRNCAAIEHKLGLFSNEGIIPWIRSAIARHRGVINGIFNWHARTESLLLEFLEHTISAPVDIPGVLREIARDYSQNKRGFPDLLVFRKEGPAFIEVKTEGDSLSRAQLRQLHLLSRCGFVTEIAKVQWEDTDEHTYVVIDVETTGGSSATDRITEIGVVRVRSGEIVDTFSTLVNPGKRIPAYITKLTGITNEAVAEAPTFADIAPALLDFIDDAVFVAHNARFDYSFIASELRRIGLRYRPPIFCTCTEMRR